MNCTHNRGMSQGSPLSPLLANVYLDQMDKQWKASGLWNRYSGVAHLIRYADDIIVLTSGNPANARKKLDGIIMGMILTGNTQYREPSLVIFYRIRKIYFMFSVPHHGPGRNQLNCDNVVYSIRRNTRISRIRATATTVTKVGVRTYFTATCYNLMRARSLDRTA